MENMLFFDYHQKINNLSFCSLLNVSYSFNIFKFYIFYLRYFYHKSPHKKIKKTGEIHAKFKNNCNYPPLNFFISYLIKILHPI